MARVALLLLSGLGLGDIAGWFGLSKDTPAPSTEKSTINYLSIGLTLFGLYALYNVFIAKKWRF